MQPREPFRVPPTVPVHAMKTYAIDAPLSTHWRPATCVEVDCPNYLNGWVTTVETDTELGAAQSHYIRNDSGRFYIAEQIDMARMRFTFAAGQRCFKSSEHRVRLDRQELYVVRDGDHRGNPTGRVRQHVRPADWIDDFGTHQQRIIDAHERG